MRSELLYFLFSPVTRLKGIGGRMSETLMRLLPAATQRSGGGVPLVRDLLFHLPVAVVDRRVTFPLSQVPDGVVATFVVKVESHHAPANKRFSKKPYQVICSNETGTLTLAFFNASTDYITKMLPVGEQRVISGRVEHFDGMAQISHPDVIAPLYQLDEVRRLEPVYPLTAGLTSKRLAVLVQDILDALPDLPEWRADTLTLSFKQALIEAHHPKVPQDVLPLAPSHVRLAYDEILVHQLQLALLRQKMQAQAGVVIVGNQTLSRALLASLPYQLTDGQKHVLAEIAADMASGKRMTRLLQGDVGSGKTIVALLAMLAAVEEGFQVALMVPTELVARQHYEVITKLVSSLQSSVTSVLLTGSIKGRERQETLQKIETGEAKVVIGTHALFQDQVTFNNLALVVVDEQHRFGVNQRLAMTQKGNAPHILHMTATPIPRSLAMLLYGDMDASLLKEKPQNRLPIATRLIPKSRYDEVIVRLKAALDRGEKAYWICPLVDDDKDDAAAALRHKEFTARFGSCVGMVHGRMKAEERNSQMQKFAEGSTTLLVATTVVEVGVDVKDATIMVIEGAERFGLSQLHQLRGRVGRGDKPSACVLLYSEENTLHLSPTTINRLSVLRETEDGFRIAEEDLKLRGGGELLGVRQSGMERTIFIDFSVHTPLIEKARDEAKQLLLSDPQLASPRGQAAKLLLQLFEREAVTN